MNFDLSAALQSLRGMAAGFFRQLPYIVIALLVFAVCIMNRNSAMFVSSRTLRRLRNG